MPGTEASHGKTFFTRKMGPLQRQLRQGEYGMFQFSPMFESDFIQISKQGGPVEIHNQEHIVTLGITSTSPVLLIPNVLLLARPIAPSEEHTTKAKSIFHRHPPPRYELTRLFPLRYVKISIHNAEKKQLRFKLVSGRTFYLQLCESDKRGDLFDAWVRIVQMLRPPSEENLDEHPKKKGKKPKSLKPSSSAPSLPLKGKVKNALKSSSPKHASSGKRNWNIHTATKMASAQEFETKKTCEPIISSDSSGSLQPLTPALPSRSENALTKDPELPLEAQELAEKSEKEPAELSPNRKSYVGEKSGSQTKRKSDIKSHRSSSGEKGRKPSKIVSLIRSCSWGSTRKDKRSARARTRGRKRRGE
ncbi:Golgi-associated RAB2 interactor protein 3-like isoform X2 [Podarcis raffonei]|uniref:Golgi-associated RAB2 interactor protein 3-like isoform X2 n=1 Tax=Podarcis raffonei TaxID=65483 RepID=UPI002329208C|nr:Golgi-associated RAB2 interactor protein 3-like isoform X2 [Podarcis raffonei]